MVGGDGGGHRRKVAGALETREEDQDAKPGGGKKMATWLATAMKEGEAATMQVILGQIESGRTTARMQWEFDW